MHAKMKVLVTGGAGYKGVKLVEGLLGQGHAVTLIDNFMYGYGPVLHLATASRLAIRRLDVRSISAADLSEADAVVHLAALSGMPNCMANPHAAVDVNVNATRRLAGLLGKEQLLIYASTTSLYGVTPGQSDETTPVRPASLYGKSKQEAEEIAMSHRNAISLRLATVFGVSPRMRVDLLVNDFTYRAVNERVLVLFDGISKRTFLHIGDSVDAYLFALQNAARMAGGIFNVGDERLNISKRDVADCIKQYRDFEVVDSSMRDVDVRDFSISFAKMAGLGYRARRTLDDGVRELLGLYGFFKASSHYPTI